MPKLKTNRAAAKRIKARSGGSLKRKRAYHNHILTKKSTKRCRQLRKKTSLDETNRVAVKRLIPYAN